MITKKDLNDLQQKKLNLAACILHKTASLYDGESTNMLPLWGGGVISHGVPKIKKCRIGITENAKNANKKDRADDHLYRVTETVSFVINKIKNKNINIEEIESILLDRSSLMTTTRSENNKILKDALKSCKNKDSWEELYKKAGIKYQLF